MRNYALVVEPANRSVRKFFKSKKENLKLSPRNAENVIAKQPLTAVQSRLFL